MLGAIQFSHVGHLDENPKVKRTPSSKLTPGASYTWRVDAVASDGTVTTGEEWTIAPVGCMDVDCVDCGVSPEVASCLECAEGYDLASGRCTGTALC